MSNSDGTILLVEDDSNDVFFLQYAFEAAAISNPLKAVADGQKAIDYLQGAGEYADRVQFPLPILVLLDLKLPVKMGFEVLRWIQGQRHLANLPVIVLTSSADAADIDLAYALGARSYLVKPVALEKRIEMAKIIKNYWLELNRLPTMSSRGPSPRDPK